MAPRALIDPWRGEFVLGAVVAVRKNETPVAIAALDEIRLAHLKPHPGMAQGPADAVAGHAP